MRLQGGQLRSDMAAFKAANPGACFEDFVRWHSPRDWHAGQGLSARMATQVRRQATVLLSSAGLCWHPHPCSCTERVVCLCRASAAEPGPCTLLACTAVPLLVSALHAARS